MSSKKARRKQWSDEQIVNAMEAVRSGSAGIYAARMYYVLPTTLRDRISKKLSVVQNLVHRDT